ncbi:MAG: ATP-binding cassette domain-containing protein [Lachnospirales bacterium]
MNNKTIGQLLKEYPFVSDFFEQNRLMIKGYEEKTFKDFLNTIDIEEQEDRAIDINNLVSELESYIDQMLEFLGMNKKSINSLTILAGQNKNGEKEEFKKLKIFTSEIISIVGPTGSGKSRLLADIEWAAQGDTPTKRSILIDGEKPDLKWRYSPNNKLVAQLSQNMNFVMDLTVNEFIVMHAQSRMVDNINEITKKIFTEANKLAGESFSINTPVTSLSGGQSRALMIADTAILSTSPIVLIDEIENAGIDRKKAMDLLVSQDKIVLIATHDPLLALMAHKRIIIKNGGIHNIIETSKEEMELLKDLNEIDKVMHNVRSNLRLGHELKKDDISIPASIIRTKNC